MANGIRSRQMEHCNTCSITLVMAHRSTIPFAHAPSSRPPSRVEHHTSVRPVEYQQTQFRHLLSYHSAFSLHEISLTTSINLSSLPSAVRPPPIFFVFDVSTTAIITASVFFFCQYTHVPSVPQQNCVTQLHHVTPNWFRVPRLSMIRATP